MRDRRGLTLVELLVVAVLGTLVLMATYGVLVTNQRTNTVTAARVQGMQTVRAGVEMLFGELREISPGGGDLLRMDGDSVSIRVMRSAGLLCDTVPRAQSGFATNPSWRVVMLGDTFQGQDSIWLFAERDGGTVSDDEWFRAQVDLRGRTTCQGRAAQELRFLGSNVFVTDTPTVGAIARSFLTYTYGLGLYEGKPYLIRGEPGGPTVPLVGPLRSQNGVGFQYLDRNGNVTGVATEVRQIVVILRTQHEARDASGNQIRDSLKTRIYTRN